MKPQLRDQVRACLTGDLSDRAKILWTFVYVCGRGVGKARLCESLHMTEDEFLATVEELESLLLLVKKGGRYTASPFALATREDPDAPSTPPAMMEIVKDALAVYNQGRVDAGVPPVFASAANLKKMTSLVDWLRDNDVLFPVFLKWVVARCEFLKAKGVQYPTLQNLAGDWLRDEFIQHKVGAKPLNEHAGKKYADVSGLREKLQAAGFEMFSKSDARYILESAQNMIVDPVHFPEPPEDFRREVYWLKRQLEAGEAFAAT